jgi:cysteine synthase
MCFFGGKKMSKIYNNIADLIGRTPLLRLSNYEKKNNLKAEIVTKLEYLILPEVLKTEL